MTVLSLSACPPKVRGYLTAWFIEIDVGVYVGDVSARVREELWRIVAENVGTGHAVMVYSTNNEQGMAFQTHNTDFIPVDYEGMTLVKRPNRKIKKPELPREKMPEFFGLEHYIKKNAEIMTRQAGKPRRKPERNHSLREAEIVSVPPDYCVIDLETSGLDPVADFIIEIGAVKVRDGKISERFQCLVSIDYELSPMVITLTGITDELLEKEGRSLRTALTDFFSFVGNDVIAGHNVRFDIAFLQKACERLAMPVFSPASIDSWIMSKQVQKGLPSYRLSELLKYFDIAMDQKHRASEDAELTHLLLEKLNEIRNHR